MTSPAPRRVSPVFGDSSLAARHGAAFFDPEAGRKNREESRGRGHRPSPGGEICPSPPNPRDRCRDLRPRFSFLPWGGGIEGSDPGEKFAVPSVGATHPPQSASFLSQFAKVKDFCERECAPPNLPFRLGRTGNGERETGASRPFPHTPSRSVVRGGGTGKSRFFGFSLKKCENLFQGIDFFVKAGYTVLTILYCKGERKP